MVRLLPRQTTPGDHQLEAALSKLVTAAFSQRRKTLRNTLAGLCDSEAILAAGCDPKARAETLSLDQFIELARRFNDQ